MSFLPSDDVSTTAGANRSDLKVERRVFAVTLSGGATHHMVGYLYYHGSPKNRPLQILTHGISYNRRYWDIPLINGRSYSYADYMARRKYALLALDVLGAGESDRPDGDLLSLADCASALHQVVQQLRADAGAHRFTPLVFVGHSAGALISTVAQGTYRDADALVNTGWLNVEHPLPLEAFEPLLGQPYVQLPSDLRALFYDPAFADPAALDFDLTALADTVTRRQLRDAIDCTANATLTRARDVQGPVLVQLGAGDGMLPTSFAEPERRLYASASSVTVQVLPDIGHTFNGHHTCEQGWAQIDTWLRATLGDF